MALIVETGVGVANANSFASVAYGDIYAASRLYKNAWLNAVLFEKEQALMTATAKIVRYVLWPDSVPVSATQALPWPRVGQYTQDSILIASTVVPSLLQDATCELADWELRSDREAEPTTRGIKQESKSVGPLSKSVVYDRFDRIQPLPDVVVRMLLPLGVVVQMNGSRNIDVHRVY